MKYIKQAIIKLLRLRMQATWAWFRVLDILIEVAATIQEDGADYPYGCALLAGIRGEGKEIIENPGCDLVF